MLAMTVRYTLSPRESPLRGKQLLRHRPDKPTDKRGEYPPEGGIVPHWSSAHKFNMDMKLSNMD